MSASLTAARASCDDASRIIDASDAGIVTTLVEPDTRGPGYMSKRRHNLAKAGAAAKQAASHERGIEAAGRDARQRNEQTGDATRAREISAEMQDNKQCRAGMRSGLNVQQANLREIRGDHPHELLAHGERQLRTQKSSTGVST